MTTAVGEENVLITALALCLEVTHVTSTHGSCLTCCMDKLSSQEWGVLTNFYDSLIDNLAFINHRSRPMIKVVYIYPSFEGVQELNDKLSNHEPQHLCFSFCPVGNSPT